MRAKVGLVVVVLSVGCAGAWAEGARREGGDTARLQTMVQQLNTDKTNLTADNAKLKADLDKTKKELDAAIKERDTGTQKLSRSSQDLVTSQAKTDALQRGFDTLKARFDQLVEQFRATVTTMKELEQERDRLTTNVADYNVRVKACEHNNDALYKSTLELMDLYDHKGMFTSMLQHEPVTKLKRVQIENLMDQYRQMADDMHLKPVPTRDDANTNATSQQDVTKASQ